ncbi:MAG: PD-(D/E)XK nuclease family protein [Rhodospirillales bacterium]|nr:PD-(D/E)XK nuclease family protein [Rhodospirillales bacterium]
MARKTKVSRESDAVLDISIFNDVGRFLQGRLGLSPAVEWYVGKTAKSIEYAVREVRNVDSWRMSAADSVVNVERNLKTVFGDFGRGVHFLNSSRLDWGFELLETQITRGFAQFLNAGTDRWLRVDRCVRLANALDRFGSGQSVTFREALAEAKDAYCATEYGDNAGRIDLLILFFPNLARKRPSAAIAMECKMNADLGAGQLRKYDQMFRKKKLREAGNSGLDIDLPPWIEKYLVARSRDSIGSKHKIGSDWTVVPWGSLFASYEICRGDEGAEIFTSGHLNSDGDFARFMRTVFETGGGKFS